MNDTINQVGAGAPAAWTKTKPTGPGAYWIRGEGEGMLARTALVEVVDFEGELWCNLHMRNTDPEFGYGYTVAQLDEAFEWLGPLSPAAPAADGTTSDKYRAELYDEVWQRARDMGYGNVTDALVELERLKAAAPVVQDTCSTCRGSGKELSVYGPATPCRDCQAAPVVQEEPVAWEVSSYGGRVDCIVVREDVAQDRAELRRINGAADVRVRPLYAAPPAHPDAALVGVLQRVKLSEEEARHHSFAAVTYWNNAVLACIAALAGKGGE